MKKIASIFMLVLFAYTAEANFYKKPVFLEESIVKKTISYTDKFSYQLDETTSWSITSTKNSSVLKTGTGTIDNFSFPEPGTYSVEISEAISAGDCNHGRFPSKIVIEVSPLKLAFDFSTIKFSNEIIGGQSQDNNTITIDVYFSNAKNESVEFTNGQFTTAGVAVNIEGKLVNEKTILTPGLNHFTYKLTGTATSQTYIMFNFIDINNQVTSYYLPTKIK